MSRKKQRRPETGAQRGGTPRARPALDRKPSSSARRGRLYLLAVTAIVALAVFAIVLHGRRGGEERVAVVFPPWPAEAREVGSVAFEDFAGAEACAECHREQYDAWSSSTHGRAGGDPGEVPLLRAFDGGAIRFRDAVVTPRLDDGAYAFVVTQQGREERVFRVDGVIGGDRKSVV